jgi:hypothetical protein
MSHYQIPRLTAIRLSGATAMMALLLMTGHWAGQAFVEGEIPFSGGSSNGGFWSRKGENTWSFNGDWLTLRGGYYARGFLSIASTLRNEEGVFDGDVVESNSPTRRRKKRRWRDELVRRQLGTGDENKFHDIHNRAAYWPERPRSMQHLSDHLDSLRDCAPVVVSLGRSAA